MESIMMDLAAGFENRNYGLRRSSDLRIVIKSLAIVVPFIAIAGCLSVYLWIGGQNIQLGYQLQQLHVQERDLLNIRQQIIIEEQILTNPEKINAVAYADLGMLLLQPNQIIPASYEHSNSAAPEMLSSNIDRSKEPVINNAIDGL